MEIEKEKEREIDRGGRERKESYRGGRERGGKERRERDR